MTVLAAEWVLPVTAPPISRGWIAIEDGLVSGVGQGPRKDAVDLGRVALLPALVNAHTHLELSYLRGRVPPAPRFLDWVRTIMEARRAHEDPTAPDILAAARAGIAEARQSGTGLVGDVSNTLVTVPLLRDEGMPASVFYELLGFNAADPDRRVREARAAIDRFASGGTDVRVSLAAHAPYSVSAGLFSSIRQDMEAHPADVSSVHLCESSEEVELIRSGTGGWRDFLTTLGVWTDAWRVPGVSPVAYLGDAGFLNSRVLVVHGVQCSVGDVARLRALGPTVVSCPRSNRHVGVGDPPLASFYASGVPVAFGTDSLASVDDLNLFQELSQARRLAPRVTARNLIESATLRGAAALGFADQFGSLDVGKRSALIAVDLPEQVDDVEEYLVSGIDAGMIHWVEPSHRRT